MAKRTQSLADQIRNAIDASGISRYRIAMDTGIDQSTLTKYVSGERGISYGNLELLVEYLDLELTARNVGPTPKRKR